MASDVEGSSSDEDIVQQVINYKFVQLHPFNDLIERVNNLNLNEKN